MKKKKFISLFSGAMGLDLGLEKVGLETSVCVEIDKDAVETIKLNRPDLPIIDRSIENVSGEELRELAGFDDKMDVPLVVGGPPCQAFSVFGNRLGIEDARGQLIFEFIRIVDELRPQVFIMENVRGLLSMSVLPKSKSKSSSALSNPFLLDKGSLIKLIFEEFSKIGYRSDCFVVNAVNYGAPQIRERLIIIGNRYGLRAKFPDPTHSNRPQDNLPSFKTLGDAIGPNSNFVDPRPDVLDFSPRKLRYLSMVPPGGNWRSLPIEIQKESMGKSWHLKGGRSAYWRKLSFSFPSPTVVTMPNHAGTSMCHPEQLRAISVGEASAIQEFPHDWLFAGNTASAFKQIGNAVPIRLGQVAGCCVQDLMQRISKREKPSLNLHNFHISHIRPHVRTRTFWKNGKVYAGDVGYYDTLDRQDVSEDQSSFGF